MSYQRVAHANNFSDGSATDAATVVNSIEAGLEAVESSIVVKANNLSDLASAASARSNLGLDTLTFNVKNYGAVGNGVADDTAAINSAIAAVNAITAGAALFFPAGTYKITAALTAITVPVHISGSGGMGWYLQGYPASTRLIFNAGVAGFSLGTASHFSIIENISLVSLSSGAENFDGITLLGNKNRLTNVAVEGFGRYGFNLDTSGVGNINLSRFDNCRSYGNRSHGYYITGPNSQAMTFTACDATGNLGWGFYTGSSTINTHVGLHASSNTLGAIYDNGGSSQYLNPYSEGGTGNNVTFDTNNSYTVWIAGAYSDPTITWNSPSQVTAQVLKKGAAFDHFSINGPGAVEYAFYSGNWNTGWFSLRDKTNAVEIFDMASAGGTFNMRVPFGMANKCFGLGVQAYSWGAGAQTLNANLGNIFQVSLTASTGAWTVSNPLAGQIMYLSVIQTGAGGFTVGTWPTNFQWASGTAPTLATTTGHQDNFTFRYDGTNWVEHAPDGGYIVRGSRIAKRRLATAGPGATPSINTDSYDVVDLTALTAGITSMTTSLTGTPVAGDSLRISFTDNGTARAITWGASFEASTVALPTTTVISTRLDVGFFWNSATSKWRCVAVA